MEQCIFYMWNYVLALYKTSKICMHKHIEHAVLKEDIEYLMEKFENILVSF